MGNKRARGGREVEGKGGRRGRRWKERWRKMRSTSIHIKSDPRTSDNRQNKPRYELPMISETDCITDPPF